MLLCFIGSWVFLFGLERGVDEDVGQGSTPDRRVAMSFSLAALAPHTELVDWRQLDLMASLLVPSQAQNAPCIGSAHNEVPAVLVSLLEH